MVYEAILALFQGNVLYFLSEFVVGYSDRKYTYRFVDIYISSLNLARSFGRKFGDLHVLEWVSVRSYEWNFSSDL